MKLGVSLREIVGGILVAFFGMLGIIPWVFNFIIGIEGKTPLSLMVLTSEVAFTAVGIWLIVDGEKKRKLRVRKSKSL